MLHAALVLVAAAAAAATADLAHKALAGAEFIHPHGPGYVVLGVGLSAAWAAAIVLARSPAMALGGGLAAGGAAANVLSLAFWPGVPNPIELDAIAFNLADVFVLGGFVFVAAAALQVALANRDRLSEPLRLR